MPGSFSPNDEFPALYRAVLEAVAALERRGDRMTAAGIRRRAIDAYSAAWTERHRNVLVELRERAHRDLVRVTAPRHRRTIDRSPLVAPRPR